MKKAIETKEEMGDMNRVFSVSQFNKYNKLPEDEQFDLAISASKGTLGSLKVSDQ